MRTKRKYTTQNTFGQVCHVCKKTDPKIYDRQKWWCHVNLAGHGYCNEEKNDNKKTGN